MIPADLITSPDKLGPAPALLISAGDPRRAAARGAVLLYHGLGASKEAHLDTLEALARAGLLAVGLDSLWHGDRRAPDYEERFAPPRADASFFEAVLRTVDEVPSVVEALLARGLAYPDRLGVAGISMGGHIAYGALLRDRRLTAAAAVIASPVWRAPAEAQSPHQEPERFFPTALLTITAARDDVVPPHAARRLFERLQPLYGEAPQRLAFEEVPAVGHMMPLPQWAAVNERVAGWMSAFLTRGA
jgi:dienelactone hydrolase